MAEHYSRERLRRGVAHFLVGKASSALLSFCGFLLVARLLAPANYGRYVALLALVELGMGLASLGLDWVSTRYVPEYRVKAGGRALVRLVLGLSALQGLLLALVALIVAACAPLLAGLLGLEAATLAIRLYAAYLFIEGSSRVLRDQMLSQLLLQGRAQLALLLRHLLWVGACAALWLQRGQADLYTVALIELLAAALGLLAAALGLGLALRVAAAERAAPDAAWARPAAAAMRRLALNSYASFLLNIPARPQVLTLMVTRLAGVEAAALYGFARNLADQVLRFLPAELLLGFVRPALVARYVGSRDAQALNRQTNVLLGISLLVLAPALVLALGQGALLVQVLGGGRFAGSALLLALMLLGVALFSHRRVLEFVANTVGQPEAIGRASGLMPLVPLAAWALLAGAMPLWSVPAVALLAELAFGALVMRQLRLAGLDYRPPWRELLRVALMVALGAGAASLLNLGPAGWWVLCGQVLLVLLALALLGLLLRPLDAQALALLKSLRH